jgi:hypothetical protein
MFDRSDAHRSFKRIFGRLDKPHGFGRNTLGANGFEL